jgi:hypothetical protein
MRFSTFIVRRENTISWQAGSPDIPMDRVNPEYSVAADGLTTQSQRDRTETEAMRTNLKNTTVQQAHRPLLA